MTAAAAPCWHAVAGGLVLRVRLTPKSSKDQIDGLAPPADGAALAVRVRAIPEDGRANAALAALVATWLDLPKSTVILAKGSKSRIKLLHIAGDPAELERLITAKVGMFD